jgi:phenylalanyl-tRNA synthetase alpha chain
MKEQLEKIYADASADIEKAVSVKDLEDIKFKYLSRKGEFNEIKKGLKDLSPDDKRIVGSLANEITQKLESSISEKFQV